MNTTTANEVTNMTETNGTTAGSTTGISAVTTTNTTILENDTSTASQNGTTTNSTTITEESTTIQQTNGTDIDEGATTAQNTTLAETQTSQTFTTAASTTMTSATTTVTGTSTTAAAAGAIATTIVTGTSTTTTATGTTATTASTGTSTTTTATGTTATTAATGTSTTATRTSATTTVAGTSATTTVAGTSASTTVTVPYSTSTSVKSTPTITTTTSQTTSASTSMPSTSSSTMTSTASTSAATTTPRPVTTAKSSPTTTISTAIPPTTLLPTRPPDYVRYPVCSDVYFSDLVANTTPSAGMPVNLVAGPFGFGAGVRLEAAEENCLHRTDFFDGPNANCLNNPSNCSETGISVSIWVNIAFDQNDNNRKYILSTGGDTDGSPGVAIYYKGVDLHAIVSNGTHNWKVYAAGQILNSTWSNIGFTWAEIDGWEMYVDQVRVAKVVYPTPTAASPKPPIQPPEIAIGCHVHGAPLRFSNYSDGKFDEAVVWFRKLNDTELPCFSGGYDASAANMSLDAVANIITQKLDLKNSGQYQLASDILEKMSDPSGNVQEDDNAEEVPSADSSPIDQQNSSFFNNSDQSSYDFPDATQPQSDSESHAIEQKINKLNTISDIIKQMTNANNLQTNMSLKEMDQREDLLQTLSNTLDLSYKEAWQQLQKKRDGSSALMGIVTQWGNDMARRTNTRRKTNSFQHTKAADNIVLGVNRLTVGEFNQQKGLTLPNYDDKKWQSVPWNSGSVKMPLDTISLPRELFQGLERPDSSSLFISNAVFHTISELVPLDVNKNNLPWNNIMIDSKVIAIQVEPSSGISFSLSYHNAIVALMHNNQEPTLSRSLLFHDESRTIPTIKSRYCASWNPALKPRGGWDSNGCELYYTNDQYTICNCDHLGAYAIIAQNIHRNPIYPDPDWLMYMKYVFYGLSALTLVIYICIILFSNQLKDQFHLIRICTAFATLCGSASMFATDFVRGDRHSCTAVTALLHYFYISVACWLLMESHALFGTMMHGIVRGKLKAYLPFAWGCPMLCLGIAIVSDFQDYGMEPRCMVSWNDNLKWILFAPNILFGSLAVGLTAATILNTSFAAVKKEVVFEDVSSVAWGLLWVSITFVCNWIFACLAYLDIEYMYPDFYPIFQVLNASLGFLIFLFMGLGSKRFRMVLRGQKPDGRHLPQLNQPNLIPVKPQPKMPKGTYSTYYEPECNQSF